MAGLLSVLKYLWRGVRLYKLPQKYGEFASGFTFLMMSAKLNRHMVFELPSGLEYLTFSSSISRSNLFSPPTSMTAFR